MSDKKDIIAFLIMGIVVSFIIFGIFNNYFLNLLVIYKSPSAIYDKHETVQFLYLAKNSIASFGPPDNQLNLAKSCRRSEVIFEGSNFTSGFVEFLASVSTLHIHASVGK